MSGKSYLKQEKKTAYFEEHWLKEESGQGLTMGCIVYYQPLRNIRFIFNLNRL